MASYSFKSFARSESRDEWNVAETLASKIHQLENSSGLRSGLLAGQSSLAMKEGKNVQSLPLKSLLAQRNRHPSRMFVTYC